MRSSSPIRAVFFDLDDTLCDTIATREARARLAFEALAGEYAHLDGEAFVSRVMERRDERDVRGVPAVIHELGIVETEAGRAAIGAWFFEGCIELLRPLEGVAETIEWLRRDYALGVITNGGGKLQRAKWLHLQLGIDLVVISAECGFEKPDPRIFEYALSFAGFEPRETIFVGDRLDVDIAGARAAGMRAVWFNHWGGSHDGASAAPDAVIERLVALPSVLRGFAGVGG